MTIQELVDATMKIEKLDVSEKIKKYLRGRLKQWIRELKNKKTK